MRAVVVLLATAASARKHELARRAVRRLQRELDKMGHAWGSWGSAESKYCALTCSGLSCDASVRRRRNLSSRRSTRRNHRPPFGRRLRRAGSFSTDATTSASRTRRYAPNTCDAVQAAGCVCAGCQCERRLVNDSNVTDAVAAPTCGSDADDPLYEAATTFVSCTVSECPDWLEDDDDSVDDGDDDEPRSCEEVAPYVDDACAVALLVDGVDECGSCGKEYSRYAACSLEFQAHSLGLGCDLTSTDCESYLVDSGTRVGAALLAGALAAAATLS